MFGSLFHGDADDFAVFLHIDRGGLTCRANHTNTVGALVDVPVNELTQGGVIHAAVFQHGGGQSHDAAGDGCHVLRCGQDKTIILAIANLGSAQSVSLGLGYLMI